MEAALVVGIITAVAGAFGGAIASATNDAEERALIDKQKKATEKEYEQQKELLRLKYKQEVEQAERQANQQEQAAALSDNMLNYNEKAVSNQTNAAIEQLGQQQLEDTNNWNLYAMQSESQQGQSLAEEAASGIRSGSSLSDAVEMQSAVNANQLQLQQDSTRMQEKNALNSILNSNMNSMYQIGAERQQNINLRDNAAYLRESYSKGGNMWNIYQKQQESLLTEKNNKIDLLKERRKQVSGWNSFWKGFTNFASGGAAGFNYGYNITSKFSE